MINGRQEDIDGVIDLSIQQLNEFARVRIISKELTRSRPEYPNMILYCIQEGQLLGGLAKMITEETICYPIPEILPRVD